MEIVWRIEMLGTLRVQGADQTVSRFRTRRVAILLAYLACFRNRAHFRDEVGEMLWPDADPVVARRNLRQALTSLRHVVEPPPMPPGSVLQVQQSRLRLNPEVVTTDVEEFERSVALARRTPDPAGQIPHLQRAIDLYRGELLPGYGEDWVVQERFRLDDLYVFALRRLIDHARTTGGVDDAIYYLRLALDKERLNEDLHVALMQQYLASGRPESALQQYEDLRRQLKEQLGDAPGTQATDLRDRARKASGNLRALLEKPAVPSRVERDEAAGEREEEPGPVVRLPLYVTRFCGRQEEIGYTIEHIVERGARLTTLVGPAGTGKTRLATEVGRRLGDTGEWNVWFVPLADVTNASMVMDAIVEAVKARGAGSQDPLDRLRHTLEGRANCLLILDNLEHIVEGSAPLVAKMVEEVPEARLLVTSRQLLRLSAEHQISVPPLPTPSTTDSEWLGGLIECPSVQLFVDRCQAVRPDFQLTANNADSVATICSMLEGVPLAIELAAGLSGSFPPSQMVRHLGKRLIALTSRRRDMPARHRSLRAAIDYSFETLTPELRRFFAALSVFRGGFKVEAAYEVCFRERVQVAPEDTSVRRGLHDSCIDLILELQERSLLRSEEDDDCEMCFRMLESFREYAEEHLGADELQSLRARHASYYRNHPPQSPYPLSSEEIAKRHLWIESEYENYVAAIEFLFGRGEYEACIEILGILSTTWSSRGPRGIERGYIRKIADRLVAESIDPGRHILLLRMLGTTYIRSMEYASAHRVCEQALAIAEREGRAEQIAVCYMAVATCAGYLGDLDECLALSGKVLAMGSEIGEYQKERAHIAIGAVHWGRAELAQAYDAFRTAATMSARRRGGEPDVQILYNLARISLDTGAFDDAMATLGDAMRAAQRVHDEFAIATCLSLVSRYYWLKKDWVTAIATGHEALLKYRRADFEHYSQLALFQQALILVDMGEWESATMLFAATRGIGRAARLLDERDHLSAIETIRKHLPPGAFERSWAKGLAMDTEEAFRLALRYR